MKFEDMISSSSMGDGFRVRTFLGFEKSYSHLGNLIPTHPPSSITDLTTRSKSLLSTLLLAYRTIDIAAAQDGYLDLELTAKIETPRTGTFGECKEVRFFIIFSLMMMNICRLWVGCMSGLIF